MEDNLSGTESIVLPNDILSKEAKSL